MAEASFFGESGSFHLEVRISTKAHFHGRKTGVSAEVPRIVSIEFSIYFQTLLTTYIEIRASPVYFFRGIFLLLPWKVPRTSVYFHGSLHLLPHVSTSLYLLSWTLPCTSVDIDGTLRKLHPTVMELPVRRRSFHDLPLKTYYGRNHPMGTSIVLPRFLFLGGNMVLPRFLFYTDPMA